MHRTSFIFLILWAAGAMARGAFADEPSFIPIAASTTTPSAIAPSDITLQAESAMINLRSEESELSSNRITEGIANELPVLSLEINARLEESSKILAASPSLTTLRGLKHNWRDLRENLSDWQRELAHRQSQFEKGLAEIDQARAAWALTLQTTQGADVPAELRSTVQQVLAAIGQTQNRIQHGQERILELQNRVGLEDARVSRMLSSVEDANEEALAHLFVRDSPPIWKTAAPAEPQNGWIARSQSSLHNQLQTLRTYIERKRQRFLLHLFVLLVLWGGVRWIRPHLAAWVQQDASLQGALKTFDSPMAVGVVLSLLLCPFIYPQAPRLLEAFWNCVGLIPAVWILRQLIERRLFPMLYALMAFYFMDQLRAVSAAEPTVARTLFLVEMAGSFIFLWILRRSAGMEALSNSNDRVTRALRFAGRVALIVLPTALIANLAGYVNLSNLLGHALLGSAYSAITLYAVLRIVDLLILTALNVPPLSFFAFAREHSFLLWQRLHGMGVWIVWGIWSWRTLDLLSLREPLLNHAAMIANEPLTLGSIRVSLTNVLVFAITVWAAILASRFIRFLLEEDIYPRLDLPTGMPYAISTLLHYLILFAGFLVAVAALGFDMTKFTILAGAFGVGVGFGTQSIINNFVSGLILLFERPIKVGDMIQINDASGVVQRIGIRATVIRTAANSDVIIPNGSLISNQVVNWTTSRDHQYTIDFPITVGAAADPQKVTQLLETTAARHPQVSKTPAPQAFVTKLTGGALEANVRVWTRHTEDTAQIRSDLTIAIYTAFQTEKIPLQ